MKNKLIIIGASGHGLVLADIALKLGYSVSFWDDDVTKMNLNYSVEKRALNVPENVSIIIGIGSNYIRKKISLQYSLEKYISMIHPKSIISENNYIGIGSVVMAGACISHGSTIGEHCIINTAAVIDHDCLIENFVHVSPNATLCGNVSIGSGSWVGAGSVIIQGVCIGKNVIIGAGAVILSNVPDNTTVVGNPGKII